MRHLLRDKDLDIEGRERLTEEARDLIHEEFGLTRDSVGRSEVDRVLADLKYRLVKKLDEEALEMASDPYDSEYSAAARGGSRLGGGRTCICPKSACVSATC